jgi:hypothetical protein
MLSGYWTDGVGCSIETLAELIGDTPKVAFDHYGREWGQHYQDPLWNAIGEGNGAKGKSSQPRSKGRKASKSKPTSGQRSKSKTQSTKKRSTQTQRKASATSRTSRSKQQK